MDISDLVICNGGIIMTHIFIVNPYAGNKTFADGLREKLKNIPNFNYFVFNTRCAGNETELVKRILHIFENEELRFYCCGGSGTMRNILNGLDEAGAISNTEVAFYPCGLTNDFLKVFGKDAFLFSDIDSLIHGDVILVDYIKTNHSIALNTVSFGLDANVLEKLDDYRSLRLMGAQLPYSLALMYSLFISKALQYEYTLDGVSKEAYIQEFCIGNGLIFGGNLHFTHSADPTDGIGSYCCVKKSSIFKRFLGMKSLQTNNLDKLETFATLDTCSRFHIKRKDGLPLTYNCDGNLIKNVAEIDGFFVKKGLSFVVPKGVTL